MDTQIWLMVPLLAATAVVVAVLARVVVTRPRTGTGATADDDAAGSTPHPSPPAATLPNR